MCAAFVGGSLGGSPFFGLMPPRPSLLTALLSQKPRSRAEWESQFGYRQKPASDTEEEKIEAAKRRVRRALLRSAAIAEHKWGLVPQGSYHNNTNVRADSDVDLVVCLLDTFFIDGPHNDRPSLSQVGLDPISFTFSDFKRHIAQCLANEYGWQSIQVGRKALHLHKDEAERISVDVVPAFAYLIYGASDVWTPRPIANVGIALDADDGLRVTNFPDQHYQNGCNKNETTGRRYKRVVRILKNIRNHIAENEEIPPASRRRSEGTSSFLLESLVYNCPNELFGHASIYDDVIGVLQHLRGGLRDQTGMLGLPTWLWWLEVNGIKSLFGSEQKTTASEAADFIDMAHAYITS